jgi:uncharacterized protein (DUF302 family)
MPDTKLLIFGDPKSGTPLMIVAPTVAIDLPLKPCVRGEGGTRHISHNSPECLIRRHDVPVMLIHNISSLDALAKAAAFSDAP